MKSKCNKRKLGSVLGTFNLGENTTVETEDDCNCLLEEADVAMVSFVLEAAKIVRSGNTTITNCRQTHGTARKSHTTITRHQEDKLSKAARFLLPIKTIAKLEWT